MAALEIFPVCHYSEQHIFNPDSKGNKHEQRIDYPRQRCQLRTRRFEIRRACIAGLLDDIASEFQGRLKVVKINIDDNEATPAKFGVRGIPTLMVFKNGENVATKVGALAKGQLTAFVEASIA